MTQIEATQSAPPTWLQDLERAHDQLQRAIVLLEDTTEASFDTNATAIAVQRCLGALYDAVDSRQVPADAIHLARAASIEAESELSDLYAADEGPGGTLGQLIEQARLAFAAAETSCAQPLDPASALPPPGHSPVTASMAVLRLHFVERGSLVPSIRVAPNTAQQDPEPYAPLDPPATFEELESYAERARAHIKDHIAKALARNDDAAADEPAPSSNGEGAFVAHWARECFDEISMLGSQRKPLLGDDWRTALELEQRMLWTVDAFASLGGGALATIERLALDGAAPDVERVFAATLLLSCFRGRDAIGLAERIARASARDPQALSRFGDASMLVEHPAQQDTLSRWLVEDDPAYREVAARILARRGLLSAEQLLACTTDRAEIAVQALSSPTFARHLDSADVDQAPFAEQLERALASTHPALLQSGWLALAQSSRQRAISLLRSELDKKHGDTAAHLLAAIGSRIDAELLLARAMRRPTADTLAAIGTGGLVTAVARLIGLLGHDDQSINLASARALERVTGAGLYAKVAIEPEELVAPELPEPNVGGFIPAPEPLKKAISDPRFAPSDGSPDLLELPDPDQPRWQAWWEQNGERFDAELRYRGDKPFTPSVALEQLAGPTLSFAERGRAGVELLLLSGQDVGFDTDDFVIVQQRALDRWRALLAADTTVAGTWPA